MKALNENTTVKLEKASTIESGIHELMNSTIVLYMYTIKRVAHHGHEPYTTD